MKNKNTFFLSLVLLVALVFNPFGTNIFELPKIHFLAIFLAITAVVLVSKHLFKRNLSIRYNKFVYIFLGLWLLSLVVSTVFSIAPEMSFWGSYDRMQGLYSHLIYLVFFLIFLSTFVDQKKQEVFLKVLVGIAVFTAIHGVFQKFGIGLFLQEESNEFLGRSFASLGHPNFLGQFLLFPIWGAIYFLIRSKKKVLPILTLIILLAALLFTENRASILGLLVSLVFFIFAYTKIKQTHKYYLFALMIFGSLFSVFMFLPSLRSLSSRMLLWQGAIDVFPEYSLLGSGLETFSMVFQKVVRPELFELEQLYSIPDRAHNILLDTLVSQGIFGVMVYSSIIISIFYLILKHRKRLRKNIILTISVSALISMLVSGFFGFFLSVHYILLMALLAILLNSSIKFKAIQIKQNLTTIFLSGMIIVLSLAAIINSTKTIYSDILLSNGLYNIYISDPEKGIGQLDKAAKLNPHQEKIYFYLADILSSFGNKEAYRIVEEGGEFTNQDFVYYLLKGRIGSSLGNYTEAEISFEEASLLAPSNPLIKTEWGNMYFYKEDYSKAIEKYEEFLNILPEYWEFGARLDELDTESYEKYRLLIKHIPNFETVISNLSESYAAVGDFEKSQYFSKFIK